MSQYKDCDKCYHRHVCVGDTDKWNYYGECPHYINSSDVVPKSETDILKSLITRKEDEAYNRGYEDGKADIFNKLDNRLAYYRKYAEVNPLIATMLQIVDDVRKEYEEVSE